MPLGEGDGSVRHQIELLARHSYDGTFSLEWINNAAQPVDPLPALQQYGRVMAHWLAEIGDQMPAHQ